MIADRAAALLGVAVARARRMAGGDLSVVWQLDLADGRAIVAKEGRAASREAAMLGAIAATGAPAPAVMAAGEDLLLLELLPASGSLGDAWASLRGTLDVLHATRGPRYGWAEDHGFGAVAICNGWDTEWPCFWAVNRLLCHAPHIDADLARRIERLAARIGDLLPATPPPALLHGDLWGGNVLVEGRRVSGLIDPACYHGDREVDFAMLTLFDHPPAHFFDGLDAGWRDRMPVYRLWPLLVHLRLSGASYRGQIDAALAALGH